jgi:hypothetical protein
LQDAQSNDTILFDQTVFPHSAPAIISVASELPHIQQSNMTIDASDGGVILDGSNAPGDWLAGLQIVSSDANTIRGLQISNFSGPGIAISGDSTFNLIGGDRSIGAGPFGQGNLFSHNAVGIDLSKEGTTLNIITGNFIGADIAGVDTLGNRKSGVWISEGANGNTIGPDNVIAHNSGYGILMDDSISLHNTITQNSIHDNGATGIAMWGRGSEEPILPIILDFDLSAGTVTGATCSTCTVEIFSDDNDEGATYEGRITAEDNGAFSFNKGVSFVGPHLTATITDADGNTSRFSMPTSGPVGSQAIQQGNDHPRTQFIPKQSGELVDNRIGAQFDSFGQPEFYDFEIYPRGVKRARVAINGLEPELVDWDRPEFSILPEHDEVFTRMADNGLTITYVLTFWDKETYPNGEGAPCARFKTEEEIQHYLDFVQFTVRHFKDRVQYFEIWNEPDIPRYCPKYIEPVDYINLVRRTVPVVRQEYPEAKITVGGISNTKFSNAYNYLFDILESDIMPLVDVVAWHPMYGTSPAYDLYRDYYYNYPAFVQEIKDVAIAHGFNGEFQADEIGWATPETAISDQPWVYTPNVASKYLGRGILMHLGMDVGVGAPDDNNLARILGTVMAAAEPVSLPAQIQSTATNIVSYAFSFPNGDHLIALWTDGVAVDNDPGVSTTLTIPGFGDRRVTGIDILSGFEQQLIASDEDGTLAIRDLLVKDYPIVLRLTSFSNEP